MRTLLITDDQEGVLQTLGYVFGEHGYRTLLAKSGAAALEIAQGERVDAALIDVHMPVMDGFTVCRSLRAVAQDNRQTFPIWLMTGAYTSAAATKAAEAGAMALLKKPFDTSELIQEIERCFAGMHSILTATLTPKAGESSNAA